MLLRSESGITTVRRDKLPSLPADGCDEGDALEGDAC
jgi:hypothetical protein